LFSAAAGERLYSLTKSLGVVCDTDSSRSKGCRSKKENEFSNDEADLKVKLVRMTTIMQSY
jgi:hypothetical protein